MYGAAYGLHQSTHERDSCGIGLVAAIDGRSEHGTVLDALTILRNLEHRGAVSGDGRSGDGAGLMCRIPDAFFRAEMGSVLPGGSVADDLAATLEGLPYAIGMFFMPQGRAAGRTATRLAEYLSAREGIELLGWRDVPIVPQVLGDRARASLPRIAQAAFARPGGMSGEEFERRLYILRKSMEREAKNAGFALSDFSVPSLSSRTIVYKGMFVASQFASFYPDLDRREFASPFAIVHQRYSTNTFPSWPLAQPFRMIAHNGEINTLRKNANAMRARQTTLESSLFGADLGKLFPILQEEGSDSAMFDNVFELLVRSGRSPEHAFMMMVPESCGPGSSSEKRAFYEYHQAIMESWDGPAAMVFCDGTSVGAASDRNGLRPFRYALLSDGRFIGASEAGALELDQSLVLEKGKLEPGRMLLIDFHAGRLRRDAELKSSVFSLRPYGEWLSANTIRLPELSPAVDAGRPGDRVEAARRAAYFGFGDATMRALGPMIASGKEATAAMGSRKAPAVLSGKPESLFSFFRQLFAQVTNPPIDPVREGAGMTLESFIGRERNLLEESPLHCRQLKLEHPVLTNVELARLRMSALPEFRVCTVSTLFALSDDGSSTAPAPGSRLKAAIESIRTAVELRVDEGYSVVILSDREICEGKAAVPALLALAAAHRRLVKARKRHMTALIVETGEAVETHHVSVLVGFGASAVNPWMVFETMPELAARQALPGGQAPSPEAGAENYAGALKKGLLKTMSKMGISSVSSYRGGGLYEAVGLSRELVDEYFPGTESRIGGIGLPEIEADLIARSEAAFEAKEGTAPSASPARARSSGNAAGGGERAAEAPWPPKLAALLTKAAREDDAAAYREYTRAIASPDRQPFALRDLFELRGSAPIPISEVEDERSIASRFCVAAMSCGALSPEAHETLAAGANAAGLWSDSGEGGEDEERDVRREDGLDRASASRQIASARFGVTARYVARARELQIKMAQGAKPGEGGQLPGAKVDAYIARLRHAMPGTTLISPPPHHDIYSIEDLSQLVHDLRCANPTARVAVKLAAQAGIGAVAAGVAKAGADCVIVSSGDGGTGAAPLSSLDYAGNSWELALPEIRQVLAMNGLADRVSIQVDGRLRGGRDVVIAAILGAREFSFGTAALISIGCVACGQCDRDRCPAGIATQKADLRARFAGKCEHVERFFRFVAQETREILASIGSRSLDEVAGRHELIDFRARSRGERDLLLDFSRLAESLEIAKRYSIIEAEGPDGAIPLVLPPPPAGLAAFGAAHRAPFPAPEIDADLIEPICAALASGRSFDASRVIRNSDRSIGAALSGEMARRGLDKGPGKARVRFTGSAGQSFGAFLSAGLEFELWGEANDFVGKSLSGGKISVRPPEAGLFAPESNVIAGNVCLFGATGGEAYLNGRAGERFAVRNSGAVAVVEGAGDHACEYMTGGRVTILGPTGVNFGAGMSGGKAFVLDEEGLFGARLAAESVAAGPLSDPGDEALARADIERHLAATGSPKARAVLADWEAYRSLFVTVAPRSPA
jgi:glutamate synthase (NADPH/NADH) large chain